MRFLLPADNNILFVDVSSNPWMILSIEEVLNAVKGSKGLVSKLMPL